MMLRDLPLSEYVPSVLPDGWRILRPFGDGFAYEERTGLRVICSTAEYDGREWMHVSVSRHDRLPSYDDLKYVKSVIVGPNRWAAQLFPPNDLHVNIHQFCLHLWVPLTGELPWPEWGKEGTI